MRGLTRDSVAEMFDRKTFYLYIVVTILAVAFFVVLGSLNIHIDSGPGPGSPDRIAEQAQRTVDEMLNGAFSFYVTFLIFLTVLAMAALFPRMLERGRADFYLSRPLSRTSLYFNKFVGVFITYGAVIFVSSLVAYVALAIVRGSFDFRFFAFLMMGAAVSLFIWQSIVICAGIISGTQTLAIMSAFVIFFGQWVLLHFRDTIAELIKSKAVTGLLDTLYYILPKTSEVSNLFGSLGVGKTRLDWMPLYSSLIFAFVVMYLTVLVFKRKNY